MKFKGFNRVVFSALTSIVLGLSFQASAFGVTYLKFVRSGPPIYQVADDDVNFRSCNESSVPKNINWGPLKSHSGIRGALSYPYYEAKVQSQGIPRDKHAAIMAKANAEAARKYAEFEAQKARENPNYYAAKAAAEAREREAAQPNEARAKREDAGRHADMPAAAKKASDHGNKRLDEELGERLRDLNYSSNPGWKSKYNADEISNKLRDTFNASRKELMCFPGETLVTIRDESEVGFHGEPINNIKNGDLVLSLNLNSGRLEFSKVKKTFSRITGKLLKLSFNGKILRTTKNHPIYSVDKNDWVQAQDLRVGELLETIDGDVVRLDAIDDEEGEILVHNLGVQKNHNYFASDILVHNCGLAAGTVGAGLVESAAVLGAGATVPAAAFVGTAIGAGYGLKMLGNAIQAARNDGDSAGQSSSESAKGSIEKVSDRQLEKLGIDAHDLKKDFLGKKAKISEYDIYKNKDTGELELYKKGGKGEGIRTGEYFK